MRAEELTVGTKIEVASNVGYPPEVAGPVTVDGDEVTIPITGPELANDDAPHEIVVPVGTEVAVRS